MNRNLPLLAAAAMLAAAPVLAQTEQQRAQATQGQTGAQNQTTMPGAAPGATAGTASTGARAEVVTTPEFMRLAAMSDRFETASSRLAGEKSQNTQIKQFAQHMVQDHDKTTKELNQLIQQVPGMGADPATPLPQGRETTGSAASGALTNAQGGPQHQGLDQQHAALLQQLQAANGAEFDRLYVRQQVQAHQQAVDMFRNYSQSGDNPQLKQWAARTLPALQEHLQMAQKLQQATQG
jgi:putative membrane protein